MSSTTLYRPAESNVRKPEASECSLLESVVGRRGGKELIVRASASGAADFQD